MRAALGCAWRWLAPLQELVLSTVLAPRVFADDTTLPVLDPGRGRIKTGRLWSLDGLIVDLLRSSTLDDGRVGLDTNTVERAVRPVARGRKNALLAGADSGGRHWAIIASLFQTAKLNDVDPLAWLTDVLERIVSGRTGRHQMSTRLPWNWNAAMSMKVSVWPEPSGGAGGRARVDRADRGQAGRKRVGLEIGLVGEIAAMVRLGMGDTASMQASVSFDRGMFESLVKVVAGRGFEPLTFRL